MDTQAKRGMPAAQALLELVSTGAVPVPPYPAVALRLQELVRRADFGLAEVSSVVKSDPVLTADVLRCANSALYSRGAPITNLNQAITMVGADQVTRLALSSGLAAQALAPGPLSALKRRVWIESLAGAALCQELARLRGHRAPEGFILGLLHDFGKVIGIASLERILRSGEYAPRPIDQWSELVDRHHVALGKAMAAKWSLPALITEIIALHHGEPGSCQDPGLLEVVRDSDQVLPLLATRTEVTSEDLASVPSLAAGERDALARVIPGIPEFVAAFEPAELGREVPSLVEAPHTALAPGQRPVKFSVSVSVVKKPRTYTAVAIASNGLVLVGNESLPENQLFELSLQSQMKPFKIWATTKLARAEGGSVRIELQPFALSGEARALWNALFAAASESSP